MRVLEEGYRSAYSVALENSNGIQSSVLEFLEDLIAAPLLETAIKLHVSLAGPRV